MGENKCVKKIEVSLEAQFNMADFTILFEILFYLKGNLSSSNY